MPASHITTHMPGATLTTQLIDSHIEAVKLDLTLWVSHTDVLRDWTAEGRQRPVLLGLPAALVATHWQSDTGKLVSTSAPSSGNDEGCHTHSAGRLNVISCPLCPQSVTGGLKFLLWCQWAEGRIPCSHFLFVFCN